MSSILDLAAQLTGRDSGPQLSLRTGTIVTAFGGLATVTIGGTDVPNVPYYSHLTLTGGNVVDILFDGSAPRIVGKF